jgi:DNA-binding NarL/FixJ family response regulator
MAGVMLMNRMVSPRSFRPSHPITVLIVEDHPLFRDGLRQAFELEDDLLVVGACANGEEAVARAAALHPRVVVLDINLPAMNGLQVLRALKHDADDVAVIVLTAYHDSEQVLHAMRAGASAYCAKDIMPDDLIEVIRDAASGLFVVGAKRMDAPTLHRWISASIEEYAGAYMSDAKDTYVPLSGREMEILEYVVQGLSNKEIAAALNISQQTVKNHMTSILKKLNVQDRTQAAVTALRYGWVRLND